MIKTCFTVLVLASFQLFANLPVFDITNFIESTSQTTQLIQQYKAQLEQYKLLLENTKHLDAFTWDRANDSITNLLSSIDTLNDYKQEAGNLNAYLSRYQSSDHYRSAPCFTGGTCTEADREALQKQEVQASIAQKRANDALLKGIDTQQTAIQKDAKQLERLQQQAQTAQGQMQAITVANELASAETNQLLQIRGLLIAEQNVLATRAAAVADKEAIQAAGDERFRSGHYSKSTPMSW